MKKTLFALFVFCVIITNVANNGTGFKSAELLHTPGGVFSIGYGYDITGKTIYGTATPVSFTDKYFSVFAGEITMSISKTDKWYTDDILTRWAVYTFEIVKNEDDCWLDIEIGF